MGRRWKGRRHGVQRSFAQRGQAGAFAGQGPADRRLCGSGHYIRARCGGAADSDHGDHIQESAVPRHRRGELRSVAALPGPIADQVKTRRWVVLILRVALAAVFIYAAWSKLRQPWLLFAMAIDAYGLLPQWAVMTLARVLPWFELALGMLLLTGLWLRHTAIVASALL